MSALLETIAVDKVEAKAATQAAAFTCEDGRVIVHSFLSGSFGADWDLSGVLQLIDEADGLWWADNWLKHDLMVLTTSSDGKRRLTYNFDVPRPERAS